MNSYLSKIEIDHEAAYKAGLRDSYSWHQKVWLAFPGRNDAERFFLTRLDEMDGGFRLLILSQEPPVKPDWCPAEAWNSKSVPETFFAHSSYNFSLVANPTRKIRSNASGAVTKNGRRIPIVKREELIDWLTRKGAQNGFRLTDPHRIQTIPRPGQSFIKQAKAGRHAATEFKGVLEVEDPKAFLQAALHGIGSAKAFGFGLLCLSPA